MSELLEEIPQTERSTTFRTKAGTRDRWLNPLQIGSSGGRSTGATAASEGRESASGRRGLERSAIRSSVITGMVRPGFQLAAAIPRGAGR
jgi:hypothetical protein